MALQEQLGGFAKSLQSKGMPSQQGKGAPAGNTESAVGGAMMPPHMQLIDTLIGGVTSIFTGGQKSRLEKYKVQQGSNRNLINQTVAQHNKRMLMNNQLRMAQMQKPDSSNTLMYAILGFVAVIIIAGFLAFKK